MGFITAGNLGLGYDIVSSSSGGVPFDLGTGSAFASSTIVGTQFRDRAHSGTRRPVQAGRCYSGDGTDDIVTMGNVLNIGAGESFTACAWIAITAATVSDLIISKKGDVFTTGNAGYACRFSSNTTPYFILSDGTTRAYGSAAGSFVADGTFQHVAYQLDRSGNTLRIFVNGRDQGITVNDGPVSSIGSLSNAIDFQLSGINGTTTPFEGKWFDARFYKSVLTEEQIVYLASKGEAGTDPGIPDGWWKCDEQAGPLCYDSSGNGHNGVITNATLSTFHGTQTVHSFQNQVGCSGAVYFDGSSNIFIAHHSDLRYTEGQTIAFTGSVYAPDFSTGVEQNFIFKNTQYAVRATTTGNLQFSIPTIAAATATTATFNDNAWNTFSVTYNTSTDEVTYVLNGSSQVVSFSSSPTSTSADVYIGGGASSSYLTGSLFDMTLSIDSTPVSTWALNTLAGNEVIDSVGGHHGKFLNGTPKRHFIPRDESDTANDVIGNALDYTGKAPQDAGLISSRCVTLDGTNDYIVLDDHVAAFASLSSGTIAGWINTNKTSTQAIFATPDGGDTNSEMAIRLVTSNTLNFLVREAGTYSVYGLTSFQLSTSTWYHIAVSVGTGGNTLYVNGVPQTLSYTFGSAATQAFCSSVNDIDVIRIGATKNVGDSSPFGGSLADFRFYDDALTSDEVLHLYDQTKGTDPGTANLIAHWPMSSSAGEIIFDASGNGYHGTPFNTSTSAVWATSQNNAHHNITNGFDGFVHFDGTDDYIDCKDKADYDWTSTLSVALWCRYDIATAPAQENLASKWNQGSNQKEWELYYDTSNRVNIRLSSDGTTENQWRSTSGITVNSFHHLAFAYQGGTSLTVYHNGSALAGSFVAGSLPATLYNGTESLLIGARGGGTNNYDGMIFDVRVYNDVLSSDEVTNIYNGGGTDPGTANLIGWWKLNDFDGTYAHDSSGNNNMGILRNFTSPFRGRIPAKLDGTSIIHGQNPSNPSGSFHNGAETSINFNPKSSPEMANINYGYATFNATTTKIDTGSDFIGTSALTACAWVKANSGGEGGAGRVFDNDGTSIYRGGSDNWSFTSDNSTAASAGANTIVYGTWQHIAVTRTAAGVCNFYVNGTLTGSADQSSGTPISGAVNVFIGNNTASAETWDGHIRDLRFYDSVITPANIASVMAGETIGATLLASYPLSWNSFDTSGNGNHGTDTSVTYSKHTVPTAQTFKGSQGINRNQYKRVSTSSNAYALFNGTSANISFTARPAATSAGTIVMDFFCSNVSGTNKALFNVGGTGNSGLVIYSDSSTGLKVQYGTGAGTASISSTIVQDVWNRITVRWSGANLEVYKNGTSIGSTTGASLTTIDSTTQVIGHESSTFYHAGGIRNVHVYGSDKGDTWATTTYPTVNTAINDTSGLRLELMLEKDARDRAGAARDGTATGVTYSGIVREDRYVITTPGIAPGNESNAITYVDTQSL